MLYPFDKETKKTPLIAWHPLAMILYVYMYLIDINSVLLDPDLQFCFNAMAMSDINVCLLTINIQIVKFISNYY